jgi:FkbM family methyltransferase
MLGTGVTEEGRVVTDRQAPGPAAPPGHHPIFQQFRSYAGEVDGSFWTDFLGVRARRSFHGPYDSSNGVGYLHPATQPVSNEYFEWISLLCAVRAAAEPFTMFELGSGWGRWLLRGALGSRQLGKTFQLIGVEAEPNHFRWMHTAFRDNGIDPEHHLLLDAAVGAAAGEAWFHVGDPRRWYGQALFAADQQPPSPAEPQPRCSAEEPPRGCAKVRVIALRDLLMRFPRIHLLNMDIQNAEADVVEGATEAIDARVELAHISTHSPEIESRLRAAFGRLGWLKVFDFACLGQRCTPYGDVGFNDGVQTWINPTASHLLTWFCEPALLHFMANHNGLLQHQLAEAAGAGLAREQQLEATRQALRETEAQLAALQAEAEWRRRHPVAAALGWRVVRAKFPGLAAGAKNVVRRLGRRWAG